MTADNSWVESFPGLLVTMTIAGQAELFSQEVLDYFGKTAEELRHWSMIDAVHPDDLAGVVAAFNESVTSGKPYAVDHRCRRADGVYRWFHVRGLLSRDEDGKMAGWFVVLTDIDDMKRAEEALRADIEERKRVEDALRELQAEMSHAAHVTSMGEMAASIAHEVNQPLSGIITNASTCLRMLSGDSPNLEGARETVRRIIRDGNRASDVITKLRGLFSKKEPALEPLDISDATREVIALSQSDAQKNGVTIKAELVEDLPPVTGDRVQLQQVILNLIRNASDAMAGVVDRPRQLLVKTERESPHSVRVSVRDAGVGIDAQIIEKVFDAFYTTKSAGMGIGLSVSRSIIRRHGGSIWATPNDDAGTTFAFSVPLASVAATNTNVSIGVKPFLPQAANASEQAGRLG